MILEDALRLVELQKDLKINIGQIHDLINSFSSEGFIDPSTSLSLNIRYQEVLIMFAEQSQILYEEIASLSKEPL